MLMPLFVVMVFGSLFIFISPIRYSFWWPLYELYGEHGPFNVTTSALISFIAICLTLFALELVYFFKFKQFVKKLRIERKAEPAKS